MKSIEDLFDLINQSCVTLIGYTFKDEREKDDLISNFNYIEIEKIDQSFSLKSFIRDIKINSLISDNEFKYPEYILLDINNIITTESRFGRARIIRDIIEKLRYEIYEPQIQLILTSPVYKNSNSELSFNSGNSPLYISDLAFTISDGKIMLQKNRFGENGEEIIYNLKQIA